MCHHVPPCEVLEHVSTSLRWMQVLAPSLEDTLFCEDAPSLGFPSGVLAARSQLQMDFTSEAQLANERVPVVQRHKYALFGFGSGPWPPAATVAQLKPGDAPKAGHLGGMVQIVPPSMSSSPLVPVMVLLDAVPVKLDIQISIKA